MTNNSLLNNLITEAGLTKEQAMRSLITITDFAKECYPILRGNIGQFVEAEMALFQQNDSLEELAS
jgi:hypothetical protein